MAAAAVAPAAWQPQRCRDAGTTPPERWLPAPVAPPRLTPPAQSSQQQQQREQQDLDGQRAHSRRHLATPAPQPPEAAALAALAGLLERNPQLLSPGQLDPSAAAAVADLVSQHPSLLPPEAVAGARERSERSVSSVGERLYRRGLAWQDDRERRLLEARQERDERAASADEQSARAPSLSRASLLAVERLRSEGRWPPLDQRVAQQTRHRAETRRRAEEQRGMSEAVGRGGGIGVPSITPRAASLQRSGSVGERLHAEASERERKLGQLRRYGPGGRPEREWTDAQLAAYCADHPEEKEEVMLTCRPTLPPMSRLLVRLRDERTPAPQPQHAHRQTPAVPTDCTFEPRLCPRSISMATAPEDSAKVQHPEEPQQCHAKPSVRQKPPTDQQTGHAARSPCVTAPEGAPPRGASRSPPQPLQPRRLLSPTNQRRARPHVPAINRSCSVPVKERCPDVHQRLHAAAAEQQAHRGALAQQELAREAAARSRSREALHRHSERYAAGGHPSASPPPPAQQAAAPASSPRPAADGVFRRAQDWVDERNRKREELRKQLREAEDAQLTFRPALTITRQRPRQSRGQRAPGLSPGGSAQQPSEMASVLGVWEDITSGEDEDFAEQVGHAPPQQVSDEAGLSSLEASDSCSTARGEEAPAAPLPAAAQLAYHVGAPALQTGPRPEAAPPARAADVLLLPPRGPPGRHRSPQARRRPSPAEQQRWDPLQPLPPPPPSHPASAWPGYLPSAAASARSASAPSEPSGGPLLRPAGPVRRAEAAAASPIAPSEADGSAAVPVLRTPQASALQPAGPPSGEAALSAAQARKESARGRLVARYLVAQFEASGRQPPQQLLDQLDDRRWAQQRTRRGQSTSPPPRADSPQAPPPHAADHQQEAHQERRSLSASAPPSRSPSAPHQVPHSGGLASAAIFSTCGPIVGPSVSPRRRRTAGTVGGDLCCAPATTAPSSAPRGTGAAPATEDLRSAPASAATPSPSPAAPPPSGNILHRHLYGWGEGEAAPAEPPTPPPPPAPAPAPESSPRGPGAARLGDYYEASPGGLSPPPLTQREADCVSPAHLSASPRSQPAPDAHSSGCIWEPPTSPPAAATPASPSPRGAAVGAARSRGSSGDAVPAPGGSGGAAVASQGDAAPSSRPSSPASGAPAPPPPPPRRAEGTAPGPVGRPRRTPPGAPPTPPTAATDGGCLCPAEGAELTSLRHELARSAASAPSGEGARAPTPTVTSGPCSPRASPPAPHPVHPAARLPPDGGPPRAGPAAAPPTEPRAATPPHFSPRSEPRWEPAWGAPPAAAAEGAASPKAGRLTPQAEPPARAAPRVSPFGAAAPRSAPTLATQAATPTTQAATPAAVPQSARGVAAPSPEGPQPDEFLPSPRRHPPPAHHQQAARRRQDSAEGAPPQGTPAGKPSARYAEAALEAGTVGLLQMGRSGAAASARRGSRLAQHLHQDARFDKSHHGGDPLHLYKVTRLGAQADGTAPHVPRGAAAQPYGSPWPAHQERFSGDGPAMEQLSAPSAGPSPQRSVRQQHAPPRSCDELLAVGTHDAVAGPAESPPSPSTHRGGRMRRGRHPPAAAHPDGQCHWREPGELVRRKRGRIGALAGGWRLRRGEVATVAEVRDRDGRFRLCNPAGEVSGWRSDEDEWEPLAHQGAELQGLGAELLPAGLAREAALAEAEEEAAAHSGRARAQISHGVPRGEAINEALDSDDEEIRKEAFAAKRELDAFVLGLGGGGGDGFVDLGRGRSPSPPARSRRSGGRRHLAGGTEEVSLAALLD
eukprot:TRINITY_DN10097_c3_g1_i1.p1 TRINITY_DN10097_c3_g1~~TRINITY_DN10097_c3_g1_i1.p1  ORF type:complete len:1779 (+),score=338.88 TRINITY_DN10097_c3_g1_i1:76-5412(+)